jgi:hypothetical protein
MIRADYCGDGRSWTVDGWQINVYDNLGIQVDTESTASWLFEAEWSPNGASCVDEYRVLELVAQGTIPACAAEKINGTCGIAPSSGVLIKSEYNSAGIVGLVAALVTGSPTGAISSDLETALHDLENGFLALAQVPPDAHAALGDFKDANQYLQLAVDRHAVDANYGRGLMNRVTGLSRVQLVRALNANACQPKDALKLLQATVTMTAGDVSRLFGQYRDAVSTYRNAFSMAKGATGKKCLVDPFQNTLEDQARW